MPLAHRWVVALLVVGAAGASGCTIAKPLVGAVTGPIIILGNSDGSGCGCNGDGRAIVCVLAALSVVGAAGGLVTGVISDFQVLTGAAVDPCANWANPFATNTQPCR